MSGEMKQKKETIELLSPAGSYEGFEAVLGAGADAVYVGGAAFGARAYAKNFSEEELLRAIDVAHIHGKKLYLTVNTLLKNEELTEQLYAYLLPLYRAGLDAVLIQDMGVLRFLKRNFPDLPIHASTQMTVTGAEGMRYLKKEGLTRIVGARELSLSELSVMRKSCDIEIEAFVHGALCYSYSGQCLMSSLLGGRSGNRGRCAQPCRLPYQTSVDRKDWKGRNGLCPLSLKDICTIEQLPELIKAGVVSLKIEGRMKQPEYAAGVTAVYRSYLDLLLEYGPNRYYVKEADKRYLMDLFNRGGSCNGYLKQHNGPSMMAFTNEKKTKEVPVKWEKCKCGVSGKLRLYPEQPLSLTIWKGTLSASVSLGEVQRPKNHPMEEMRIRQQMEKLGNEEYEWESLEIEKEEDIFVPVGMLNEIRRKGFEAFQNMQLQNNKRKTPDFHADLVSSKTIHRMENRIPDLYASCETPEQAFAAVSRKEIKGVYTPFSVMKGIMEKGIQKEKECYLSLPHIVRGKMPEEYLAQAKTWIKMGMKGFLVRSLESFAFLVEQGLEQYCVIDASLYTWNNEAVHYFHEKGILRDTAPFELNEGELSARENEGSELIIYGYLPLMTSAQCVRKNCYNCDRKEGAALLKDRYHAVFQSKCYCHPWKTDTTVQKEACYNIIYNSLPYGLLKEKQQVNSLGFSSLRLSFTIEDQEETEKVLNAFIDVYCLEKPSRELMLTRGHFRRGAE